MKTLVLIVGVLAIIVAIGWTLSQRTIATTPQPNLSGVCTPGLSCS